MNAQTPIKVENFRQAVKFMREAQEVNRTEHTGASRRIAELWEAWVDEWLEGHGVTGLVAESDTRGAAVKMLQTKASEAETAGDKDLARWLRDVASLLLSSSSTMVQATLDLGGAFLHVQEAKYIPVKEAP